MSALYDLLAVGFGGAVGTLLRYVAESAAKGLPSAIWAVAAINVLGAYLVGFLATLLIERLHTPPPWRLLLTTGILGGFTTFGTLMVQLATLLRAGDLALAAALALGEVLLGLVCTVLGAGSARRLPGRG